MPKKLAELVSKGDGLQQGYEECIAGLRRCAQSGSQHESMIQEGEEELKHRIDILVKGGKKGTLVKDFDADADVKSFIAGIEGQKAALHQAMQNLLGYARQAQHNSRGRQDDRCRCRRHHRREKEARLPVGLDCRNPGFQERSR
ncbi:MAG: hypothetical protein JNM75_09475 [Rhodospirillales bacterium]|nr:hypothetical protein [Rhodospirillales bacterium]